LTSDDSGPRPLRILAALAACTLLTGLLVLRSFPYDLLARRVAQEVEATTGTQVSFGALEPQLTIAGPGFEATAVRVQTPGGTLVQIDRAALRPAWSLAWLRLAPALHADIESVRGNAAGVFVLGSHPSFSGRLETVDLARLPLAGFLPGVELAGMLEADVDLSSGEAGPEGSLTLHAVEGSVRTPELPIPLPFESLDGELVFGDGQRLHVNRFESVGPLFSADVTGSAGEAEAWSLAPLDLEVSYHVEPGMRSTLEGFGLSTKRDGSGSIRVRGTPGAPIFQ
jgi:type II secretion system protein N